MVEPALGVGLSQQSSEPSPEPAADAGLLTESPSYEEVIPASVPATGAASPRSGQRSPESWICRPLSTLAQDTSTSVTNGTPRSCDPFVGDHHNHHGHYRSHFGSRVEAPLIAVTPFPTYSNRWTKLQSAFSTIKGHLPPQLFSLVPCINFNCLVFNGKCRTFDTTRFSYKGQLPRSWCLYNEHDQDLRCCAGSCSEPAIGRYPGDIGKRFSPRFSPHVGRKGILKKRPSGA